ncbi:MAG: hypothetical protein WCZ10_10525 [Desulfobulbaceae bacterium]
MHNRARIADTPITVIHGWRRTYPVLLSAAAARDLQIPFEEPCRAGVNRRKRVAGCGKPGALVRVWVNLSPGRAPLIPRPCRYYCQEHGLRTAKRHGLTILDSRESYLDYQRACIVKEKTIRAQVAEQERRTTAEMLQREEERKRRELEIYGFNLLLSGAKGRLVRKAGGALACLLYDGTEKTPCCALEAARIIDNRTRGQVPPGHSEGCHGSGS